MCKRICAVFLLFVAVSLNPYAKSAEISPIALTTPTIVASGKTLNQGAPFSKTLYTPGVSGVYRLTVYATIATADPSSTSSWQYSFGWTDVTGKAQTSQTVVGGNDAVVGGFWDGASGMNIGGVSRTFQASKGTPITHSMTLIGSPDSSAFSVFYVLERLQ